MSKLTTEFKKKASMVILTKVREVILSNFKIKPPLSTLNSCGRGGGYIKYTDGIYFILINQHCFYNVDEPYFEDYCVTVATTIEKQKIFSSFFLEWENNVLNTKLIKSGKKLMTITRKPKYSYLINPEDLYKGSDDDFINTENWNTLLQR